MPVENNRRIAEWLGLCVHIAETGEWPFVCQKCGIAMGAVETTTPPDFTTFAGMEVLLKGLHDKGLNVSMALTPVDDMTPYYALVRSRHVGFADTLPLALTEAVLKLIEQGETNGTN